ncbi:MAG: hypothetical protein AB1473_22410 [Thermodesulfobacteriota bacterium]
MKYRNRHWGFELELPKGWRPPGYLKRLFWFSRYAQQSIHPQFYGPSGAKLKIAVGPIWPVPSVEEQQNNLANIATKYGHRVIEMDEIRVSGKRHATMICRILEVGVVKNYSLIFHGTEYLITAQGDWRECDSIVESFNLDMRTVDVRFGVRDLRYLSFDLFLWPLCGFVWWSWAHMMTALLPGRIWLAGGPAVATGAVIGLLAYFRFVTDARDGLALKLAYVRVNMLVLVLGVLVGGILGWVYAMGDSTGPASLLPGYRLPPTTGARVKNSFVCAVLGVLANSGMMYSLGKLGDRPWLLFACLLGAVALLYVVVPMLFIRLVAG